MTDKPTPKEIDDLVYELRQAGKDDTYSLASAVLAKWGTPAPVGAEPVALLVRKNSWRDGQWEVAPPNSPSYGLAWANQRMYVYTTPQPTQPQAGAVPLDEYPALVCDYCGALTPDPWHSSGMLHGKMSKHIHSCDACAARAPADSVLEDAALLDFIQERGATIEVLPGRPGWTFRVGGLHGGVHRSVRAAIDAERQAFRVHGRPEPHVTRRRQESPAPPIPAAPGPADGESK